MSDLTLAEIRTLRSRETQPLMRADNTRYDGMFGVPTLDEVLDLVEAESRRRGETVDVHIETKHPAMFAGLGHPIEPLIVAALRTRHLDRPNAPVVVQSFDAGHLRSVAATMSVPIVQLLDHTSPATLTPAGLREVSTYARAIGIDKDTLLDVELVRRAHDAGVGVHAWTFRDENVYLPRGRRLGTCPWVKGDAMGEYVDALGCGLDAVITDFPDTAREALAWVDARALEPGLPGVDGEEALGEPPVGQTVGRGRSAQ